MTMLPDLASGELDRLLYRAFQFGMRVSRKAAGAPSSVSDDEKTRSILRQIAAGKSGLIRKTEPEDELLDAETRVEGTASSLLSRMYPHDQELAKRILAASPKVMQ
jgi:hypothetical protein